MAVKTRSEKTEPLFGFPHALQLGIILLAGIVLSIALLVLQYGHVSLLSVIAGIVPEQAFTPMGTALWLVEITLFFYLAWQLSEHNALVGAAGIVFGAIVRLIICLVITSILHLQLREASSHLFMNVHGELWPIRLLGIGITALIFQFPCRRLIASGFIMFAPEAKSPTVPSAKQFSFTKAHVASSPALLTRCPTQHEENHLSPPEDFTPVAPQNGVSGLVTIPTDVIYASIPEALKFLAEGEPVRVRLAYLVPQLRRPTAWLSWQQIFINGPQDPNVRHGGPNRSDAELQGRWVAIPPKYYALQVPRQYFSQPTPNAHPVWITRPAVPQEAQCEIIVE